MQITIVVDDRLVLVDRKPLELDLDWSVFDLDPHDPNDDVSAVQFDTDVGQGHVEFKTRFTKQSNRPNVRPPDWHIGAAEFEKHFSFVLPVYEAKMKKVKAEQAAREAERANLPVDPAPAPVVEGVSREEAQRMAEKAAADAVAAFAAEIVKPAGG